MRVRGDVVHVVAEDGAEASEGAVVSMACDSEDGGEAACRGRLTVILAVADVIVHCSS